MTKVRSASALAQEAPVFCFVLSGKKQPNHSGRPMKAVSNPIRWESFGKFSGVSTNECRKECYGNAMDEFPGDFFHCAVAWCCCTSSRNRKR